MSERLEIATRILATRLARWELSADEVRKTVLRDEVALAFEAADLMLKADVERRADRR